MKKYLNKKEFFLAELDPDKHTAELNFTQVKFSEYLKSLKLIEDGDVSASEKKMIQEIKDDIASIKKSHPNEDPSKFDFDIAKIFHQHLKIERALLNDWGFWRWLSLNYFVDEIQWRWAKKLRDKQEMRKAAVAIYDHLTGKSKNHRIFPRRYYSTGLRLFDGSYALLNNISMNLKNNQQGGYGDFINYLVDTKLLSFNDNAAKKMGKLLLSEQKVMTKDVVVRSFKRFNGFKNRLISDASDDVFKNEICQL